MIQSNSIAADGLLLVSASAGSGKTYRLTQEVTARLHPDNSEATDLEGLVAVTYTTKAQAELESRLRSALMKQGAFDRAESLPLAYLGTVHAVCLKLLKEFAIDAGVSPAVDGLPQEAARHLLQEALERELSVELRQRLEECSQAIELNWDGRTRRHDWITPVEQIMTLARSNRLAPAALDEMAQRSVGGFLDLLAPEAADGTVLERHLADCLDAAIAAVLQLNDGQQNTATALHVMQSALRQLQVGQLPWSAWCKLSKLKPGKRAVPLVEEVLRAAGAFELHPLFRANVRATCEAIFEAARVGLQAYADWKARRGLVDYIDMIDLALTALELPAVEAELEGRLGLFVVDEFQDTSPIQLALFTRIHQLARRSIWVGDRKQCIFEYAGADPTLMDAVARWVKREGGQTEILRKNFRSRPELVEPISALFARAFERQGHTAEEVTTVPHRAAQVELAELPALGVWWLQTKGTTEENVIALGIAQLLRHPERTPIVDRQHGNVRCLQAGDIAVLVATNNEAQRLSVALAALGIASVLPRTGLMRTPEGSLLRAALAYVLDRADTLASAEIEALLGFGRGGHEAWLQNRIRSQIANEAPPATCDELSLLDELRPGVTLLSPREIVDTVLAALNFPRLTRRWPDPDQRLANLDALRALASAYEDRATYLREAASLGGLLRYLEETQIAIKQQDEERALDEQHVGTSASAVVLSTYHKAKGLEWPVVVLASLDRESRRDSFSVAPETERATFDASDPLGQRWIRYWPWPLGQQHDAPLRTRATESEVGRSVALRDARERVRLLYVGFTRAREHLILALATNPKGTPRCAWLDELADANGPLLALSPPETPRRGDSKACELAQQIELRVSTTEVRQLRARVWSIGADAPTPDATRSVDRTWFRGQTAPRERVPFAIHPSSRDETGPTVAQACVVSQTQWSNRMPFTHTKDVTWDQVGTALHAFLASDLPDLTRQQREVRALRILTNSGLAHSFAADALIAASDAWRAFVEQRWPGALWHREVPVTATLDTPQGLRQIEGTIDLLLETAAGVVIVDHKSFPGRVDQWVTEALKYGPQLMTYSRAMELAGYNVVGQFVHFTIGGGVVELAKASNGPVVFAYKVVSCIARSDGSTPDNGQ